MEKAISALAAAILSASLLTPVMTAAEEPPASLQDEATGAGAPSTSPNRDSDRIPEESVAPAGAESAERMGKAGEEDQEQSGTNPFASPEPGEEAEAAAKESGGDKRVHDRERTRYMEQQKVREESQSKMRAPDSDSGAQ